MQVVAWPLRDPGLDLGMLVGGIVVKDEMDVEIRGGFLVDQVQEGKPVLMAMPLPAFGNHPPRGHVQGGKQRGGAVADIVMGEAFDIAQVQGEFRLGAVQRLDLGFLIHAQHYRMVGRIQVKPRDIADFLDKEGIGGQLEGLCQMGLDAEQGEPAMHGGLGDALGVSHQTQAPVGRLLGLLLKRMLDDGRNFFIVIGAGAAGAQFIVQTLDTGVEESAAPLADRLRRGADPPGDGCVGQALGASQDHAGSQNHPMRHRGGVSHPFELVLLLWIERQRHQFASTRHGSLLSGWNTAIILHLFKGHYTRSVADSVGIDYSDFIPFR